MIAAYYIAMMIFAFLEVTVLSAWWPVLALVAYLWFLRLLYRQYPRETMLTLILAITKILILFSLIMIGLGFWITELQIVGQLPVYSCYFCIVASLFIHAACVTAAFINRFIDRRPAPLLSSGMGMAQIAGAVALVGLGSAVLLSTGITQGFATLDGVDRFEFRAGANLLFNLVVSWKYMMVATLATARFRIASSAATRYMIDAVFAAFVGLLMLFGDKFLSVIVIGIFYSLPAVITGSVGSRVRVPLPLVVSMLTMLPLVLTATVWVYSDFGVLSWDTTLDRLFGRTTGQGQVWYIVARENRPLLSIDGGAVQKLLGSMGYHGEPDPLRSNVGIFYIISRYAPTNIYRSILANDGLVQFTGGFEAYLILLFGQAPMIVFTLIFGIFAGLSSAYIYYNVKSRSVFGSYGATYIYMTVYSAINQGAIWMSVGIAALIISTLYVLADQVLRQVIFNGVERPATGQVRVG